MNKLLSDVEGRVRRWFESGLIADLDRLTGDEADVFAMWSIGDARELAWDQAETLWKLKRHPDIAGSYEDALSWHVATTARGRAWLIYAFIPASANWTGRRQGY